MGDAGIIILCWATAGRRKSGNLDFGLFRGVSRDIFAPGAAPCRADGDFSVETRVAIAGTGAVNAVARGIFFGSSAVVTVSRPSYNGRVVETVWKVLADPDKGIRTLFHDSFLFFSRALSRNVNSHGQLFCHPVCHGFNAVNTKIRLSIPTT